MGAAVTFTGGADGKGTDWATDANWDAQVQPGIDDDVVIDGKTVVAQGGVSVKLLTISGAAKVTFRAASFDGESTEANLCANATAVRVTDAIVISDTAVVTAENDPITGSAVKFECASFRLGAQAKLTANEKGWFWYAGTDDSYRRFTQGSAYQTRAMGPGNSYSQGGGYGAAGGGAGGGYCQAYGFQYAPFLPGSPNGLYQANLGYGNRPGGTVWLKCSGICELYGTVSADGQVDKTSGFGAASGGGVWICAQGVKAADTTSVTARGGYLGTSGYGSTGAGGRISLALGCTDAQLDALARGETPSGLTCADGIGLFAASARGGLKGGVTPTYGNDGTVTTVTGPNALSHVKVCGSPVSATGVEPANGVGAYTSGSVQAFTAPEFGADPDDPNVRYRCAGYVLADADGEVSRGSARSVEVTVQNGPLTLTWQWGEVQKRARVRKSEHGTVTVDGVSYADDAIFWAGTIPVSVAVTPETGYEFVCWEGNVPLGKATQNPFSVTVTDPLDVTPVVRPVAAATTRTWKANASGDWKTAANWEPAGIPGAGDTLVIASGTVLASNCLAAAALEISGGALKVGTAGNVNGCIAVSGNVVQTGGAVTLGLKGHVRLAVGGNLTLSETAALSVYGGAIDDDAAFANGSSFVAVGGTLSLGDTSVLSLYSDCLTGGSVKIDADAVSVGASAKIDAEGKGFAWLDSSTPPNAPGLGYSYSTGGSHGGKGGGASVSSVYDSPLAPVMPGSPNGSYSDGQRPAGGVIRIHARSISVDGTLDADAYSPCTYGGAAGGSIWLAADAFAFGPSAKLTAEGGPSSYSYSQGGGGRIALAEGCTAAELTTLAAGELPLGAVLYDRIDGVETSVLGGKHNSSESRAESGTVALVRSRSLETVMTVRMAIGGLVTEGDITGERIVNVGEATAFTAPEYGYDQERPTSVRWPIVGYVVSNCTAEVARGEGRSYTLTAAPDGGPYSLTWLLGPKQYSCAVSFVGDGAGTVSDGETQSSVDFLAWGTEGGNISLSATPAQGSAFAEFRSSLLAGGYSPERTVVLPVTYLGAARVVFELGFLKRVYVGGATSDLADPLSWLPRGVPTAEEAVIFSNVVRTITTPLKVAQMTVSGGQIAFGSATERTGFSLDVADSLTVKDGAKVTFYARELGDLTPFTNQMTATEAIWTNASVVTVGGLFSIRGGATVRPANAPVSGTPVVFRVGSFDLAEDGTIDATALGWSWADLTESTVFPAGVTPKTGTRVNAAGKNCDAYSIAFGTGSSYGTGAGYGGKGCGSTVNTYGFRAAPFLPGSPSGCNGNWRAGTGGGSVCVLASGAATVAGKIVADGELYAGCSGPSGGGIWLAADSFDFGLDAVFSAKGGNSAKSGAVGIYAPGGGGRIAVSTGLTAAQIEALATGSEPTELIFSDGLPFVETCVLGGVRPAGNAGTGDAGTVTRIGSAAQTTYEVRGAPVTTRDVQPAAGVHSCTNGATVRFTAEEYGRDLTSAAVRYPCLGYVVSNACSEVASGVGRSVDVTMSDGPVTVTWLWGAPQYGIVLHRPANGTLTMDGVDAEGDLAVWPEGASPSLGVRPNEGCLFAGWQGNLPQELLYANPFSLTPTNGVEATPKIVRAASPSDGSIIAVLEGRGKAFETALDVSPMPEAFGIELASAAEGAVVTVELVDAKKNAFTVAVPVTGTYALFQPDDAWALPVKVTAVRVTAGDATLKSLRGVYAERLPHAGPYFAALESLEQPLENATVVTANKTRVDIPAAGVKLVLHNSIYNSINFVWDDGSTLCRGIGRSSTSFKWGNEGKLGLTNGTTFVISDAHVNFTLVGGLFVRPNISHYYSSNPTLSDIGLAYAMDCEQLPKASEHVNDLIVTPNEDGGARIVIDGSYVGVVRSDSRSDAQLVSAYLSLYPGAEYALKDPPPAYDADRWTVLDLAANPRAKAFKDATLAAPLEEGWFFRNDCPVKLAEPLDSADVAIAHYAHKYGGYSDAYMSREPLHGFGSAVHYRVPARNYVRANLVVALDSDATKDRVLNLRVFSHCSDTGESGDCGSTLVVDTKLDWTAGPGAGAEQIGLVQRGEELIPLYAVTVPLDLHKLVPEAARNKTLDIEFMGEKVSETSLFPEPTRESAFNLFGVTLESAPVTMDIVQDGATGNVFTQDEADRHILLRMKAIRATSGATVSWTARTRAGVQLFAGSADTGALEKGGTHDIAVDLSGVADPDLYLIDFAVSCEGGAYAYAYPSRFAILPPSDRAAETDASPYATWWNCGSHGTTSDWDVMGPFFRKAGIRKVQSAKSWDKATLERYRVTYTGQCSAPGMGYFNITNGQFFAQGDLSGEQWFVNNVQNQINSKPRTDHIMIWHESAPSGNIPEEILGLPIPEATESDRKAGAYINEIGRLVRQYFPSLRIQIGNSTASLGAASKPFRGGADPQYYDSVGIEIPSQTMMPERLLVQSIQGMMMTKASASYYAGRPVRACGCFEYTYRTTAVGEELQAAYYMRDTLISLANEMPMISPGIIVDAKDYYYENLYGCCGMAYRTPWCEPKLAYVAYAALTKALDGVTLLEEMDTGSTTVYALSFRRCDGKYAVALWTARGEATLAFEGASSGDRMGFLGKVTAFDGTAEASELPSYVITDTRLTAARIVNRGFRQAETAASRSVSVCKLDDATALTVDPDARIKSRAHGCLPMMTPSTNFSARTVLDRARGRCVEVSLDTSVDDVNRYYTEYSTIRFAEPQEVPAGATAIGAWVKGNSSWGQIRFEITDADGDVFVTYGHPGGNYDPCDWQGTLCVNFDDWAYVSCKLPNNGGLAYSAETGLRTSPWYCEVRGKGANGSYDGPGLLTAVTVGMNREKLFLTDFKATDTRVRLADVRVEGVGTPEPEPVSVNVWEGAATGDWFDAASWSLGRVPSVSDDVLVENATLTATNVIASGMLVLDYAKLTLGDTARKQRASAEIAGDLILNGASELTVLAGELDDYAAFASLETTVETLCATANVISVGGAFSVGGTSVVYPDAAPLTGVPVVFRVGGAFTLDADASFDVRNRGWGWSAGAWADRPSEYCKPRKTEGNGIQELGWTLAPGSGLSYGTGGNYGGNRSASTWQGKAYAQRYGSDFAPVLPGSPSGNYIINRLGDTSGRGPGSVVVLAAGAARLDGVFRADGDANDHAGSSGGGIWLAASRFAFGASSQLSACGGNSGKVSAYGPGNGGRIALAEGCTAAQLEAMQKGTLPDDILVGPSIDLVTASVVGGVNPSSGAKGLAGTCVTARPRADHAILTVKSDVANLVAEGVVFGDCTLTNGTYAITAPAYAYLDSDDGVRYSCAGFVVSNATGEVVSGAGRTANFTISGLEGPYSLTWRWTDHRIRNIVSIAGSGSVAWEGESYTTNFVAWMPYAIDQTFVATPASKWIFSGWSGSAVPSGSAESSVTIAPAGSVALDASFSSGATSRRWVGSAGGLWSVAANWSPAGVPSALDDVYITNATLTAAGSVSVSKLVLSGSTVMTFRAVPLTGETTAATLSAGATVVAVAESMEIVDGATVIVENDAVSGAAVRFDVGSLTLTETSRISADLKGWFWYAPADGFEHRTEGGYCTRALGAGSSYSVGAGHGSASKNASATAGLAYGFPYAPFMPGSPNGLYQSKTSNASPGGGTVWIRCGGLCKLDGTITADAKIANPLTYGSASGGGIWIATRGIAAGQKASLSARGGNKSNTSYGSEGSGGRISIALGLTDAQLDALAAGETPGELAYADRIDLLPADVSGGTSSGQTPTYGKAGTATTVTGPLAWRTVIVKGTPCAARSVTPDYGAGSYPPDGTATFTADAYGIDPSDEDVRYACAGYVVSNALGEVTRGTDRSVTINMANAPCELTWIWGAAEKRVIVRRPEHATLLIGGVAQAGDAVQWAVGTMSPVTVVPDEGYEFLCWEGKLPLGQATANPLSFSASEPVDLTPVLRVAEAPTARTWRGGTGLWTDASKWEPANVPGPNDSVTVGTGTCLISNALKVASLTVSGGKLTVGGRYGVHAGLSVTGDLTLSGSGVLTVWGGPTDAAHSFAVGASSVVVGGTFALADTSSYVLESDYLTGGSVKTVARRFVLGASAKVDACERGWRWVDGNTPPDAPGLGFSFNIAGSYGAAGGGNGTSSVYGWRLSPVHPGSPNGNYSNGYKSPGGLVRIHAHEMRIDGTVTADAHEKETYGGASGGGIWLTADKFAFGADAVLTARGGGCYSAYGSNGGGGRIAIGLKLSRTRLESLAESGMWVGIRSRHEKSLEAFRSELGNGTMTIDVSARYTGIYQPDRPGTFAFVDGRDPPTVITIR